MLASTVVAGLGLALTSHAHLFLSSPQPIEGSAPKDPLDGSGSNFPCHGVALPSSGGESMPAGSSQLLAFDTGKGANTAVHGGGSCQISITYETAAAKVRDPKNWFVIYSIEGGCPSSTYANLDASYQGPQGQYSGAIDCTDPKANGVDCINQFNFTIPKGVKDGHAIMAWTWFNTVGNREMYMNCINTQLSGGDGSEMSSFPNMFVANLQSVDTCPTTAYQNVLFPNPGSYVTTVKPSGSAVKTTYPMATPTGSGCSGDGGSGSGGSESAHAPAAASSPAAAPVNSAYGVPSAVHSEAVSQASDTPPQPAGSNAPLTVTTMATITEAASSAAAPSAAAPSAAGAAPAYGSGSSSGSEGGGNEGSSNGTSGSSAGGSSTGTGTCSSDGSVVCNGPHLFGLCNAGSVVWQPVADGTTCSGGQIMKKRSMRHMQKHAAGRRSF